MLPRIAKTLCFLFFAFCFAAAAQAGEAGLKDSVPHVTVMGSADIDVSPDIAVLSLGVVTERPEAANAVKENARAGQALVEAIKAQGIEARDIKTVSITLSPVYDTNTDAIGHTTGRKLRGYSAHNLLEVRFRDLTKAGKLASQWVGEGANEVQGLHFDIEHPDAVYERLRGEAMQDALRRAKAYLPPTGLKLGRIIEITAGDVPEEARPILRFEANKSFGDAASVAIPIEPGTQNLHTTVRVTWELVQ